MLNIILIKNANAPFLISQSRVLGKMFTVFYLIFYNTYVKNLVEYPVSDKISMLQN